MIGTPVPAVIGTDYRALDRMLQKKTDLPVLTVNTDGMELYDKGEEKAYLALFQKFADAVSSEKNDLETEEKETDHQDAADEKTDIRNVSEDIEDDIEEKRIGIIGMTPQDVSDLNAADKIRKIYKAQGIRAVCYGMGDGLEEVKKAGTVVKNVVVSPAALKAAQYLEKKFGTPYEVTYPLAAELVPELEYNGKKILIVQQQVIAKAVREEIFRRTETFSDNMEKTQAEGAADITTATWFMIKEECERTGVAELKNQQIKETISLKEEEDFISLVEKEDYDMIFADPCMEKMIPEYEGTFIPLTHFAVSGKLNKHESVCEEKVAEKKR